MHFPTTVRYARGLGLPTLGMTGKFHVTWGHFSSFKAQPALEYESFVAVANTSAVSIGDQLHPRGELCPETYDRIGRVYRHVRDLEPWLERAEAVTEIAVFNTEAIEARGIGLDPSLTGAVRTLTECAAQFDVVDGETDWSRYRALLLPDTVTLDVPLAEKLSGYLAGGGSVLATHRSGLARGRDEFGIPEWPVRYHGVPERVPDFILAGPALAECLPGVPWVCYETGLLVEPEPGAGVLAETWEPYFSRAWDHFCSHFHSPVDAKSAFPSAVRRDRCIYLSHPHFASYDRHGAFEDARIVRNALELLVPDPLVLTDAPSTCHVTLTRQPSAARWMAHLLHYIPERRCAERDVVREVIPLHTVELSVKLPHAPAECYLAPSREPLPVSWEGGYARVTVPEVRGYAVTVFEGVEP
jgi:hypothetical protein